MNLEEMKYNAFISYRHNELDSYVAKKLMKKLENFKIPKELLEKLPPEKQRIERIFRDEDELPLADNLSDPIETALKNSEFLIVICTPRLPLSAWCQKEIETFMKLHDRDHVLTVLAEGEPEESFPEILTKETVITTDESGNEITQIKEYEPLAAEARGRNKFERDKNIDGAATRLAAALLNVNYDDLKQRRKEQHQQKLLKIGGAIFGAVSVFALVCLILLIKISVQNKTIASQYERIQSDYASNMADKCDELMHKGRKFDAVFAVTNAMPKSLDDKSVPYSSKAHYALSNALGIYRIGEFYSPHYAFDSDNLLRQMNVSLNADKLLTIDEEGNLKVFNTDSGSTEIETALNLDNNYEEINVTAYENGIVYTTQNQILYRDNNGTDRVLAEGESLSCLEGNDGLFIFCDGTVTKFDASINTVFSSDIDFSPDGVDYYTLMCFEYDKKTDSILAAYSYDLEEQMILVSIDAKDGKATKICDTFNAEYIRVLRDQNRFYILYDNPDYYYYENQNLIIGIDMDKTEVIFETPLTKGHSISLVKGNDTDGEFLFVGTNYGGTTIDPENGMILTEITSDVQLISSYVTEDERVYSIAATGEILETNSFASVFLNETLTYYDYSPSGFYLDGCMRNGKLFLLGSSSDYVQMYETNKPAIVESKFDESKIISPKMQEGISVESRGKDTIVIKDDKGYSKTLYDISGEFKGITYCSEIDSYILTKGHNSYLLNKEFDVYAQIPLFNKYENGSFEVYDDYGFYSLLFVDYDELMQKASDSLSGYEPNEKVKERYM